MKNRRSNWQMVVSGILIFAVWFGALPVFAQTRQDGKGVGVKVVSELPSKEKRWALIVGIDEYQNDVSTLKGSVNDARALKNVLVNNAGFPENQIVLLTTDSAEQDKRPTRDNILGALSDLTNRVPEDGLLLFSFSGHGISVGDQAFLIPSNGRFTKNPELLQDFSIDVARIKRAIETMKVKQVLMLLDACRNEPGKGDTPNNLTNTLAKGFSFDVANSEVKAFATLYATSIGERAFEFYDKDSKQFRGYFSYAVEEALKGKAANEKGEVTLSRLIDYLETTVPKKVKYDRGENQTPKLEYSETYRANQLILAVATSPSSGEAIFWSAIQGSNDIEDFESYLKRTESGEFKGIYKSTAKQRITKLKETNIAAVWVRLRRTANRLLKYDFVLSFSEGLYVVTLNGKWGLVDKSGQEAVPLKYDVILPNSHDDLSIVQENGKYGFIDKNGEEVVTPKFEYWLMVQKFSDGLINVELKEKSESISKYGFIDKSGKEVIPIKYDLATDFSDGLASVKLNGKWSFIDKSGNDVRIPLKSDYDIVFHFTEGLAQFQSNNKIGFIDKSGREIIPLKYDEGTLFSDGLSRVKLNKKWGFIDKSGKEIIPLKYDDISYLDQGLIKAKLNDKWGLIDKSGRGIIPFKYDEIGELSDGLVSLKLNGKWGFIDRKGTLTISFRYDSFEKAEYSFSDGISKVRLNNKWGFIDKSGKEVITFKYEDINSFSEGSAVVKLNGKEGLIDKSGREIIPIKFDDIWCYIYKEKGFYGVTLNGKKGFVDIYGNEYFDF